MFNTIERDDLKTRLINMFKEISGILGVVLVGSGAVGFDDEYSDIDFCVVVDDSREEIATEVMCKCSELIKQKFNVLKYQNMPQRFLQIYLMDNFIEVDIGFVRLGKLEATRERWSICFDNTGKINKIMIDSWDRIKNYHGKKTEVDICEQYRRYYDTIWYYIVHSLIAIKRGQVWRGVYEINLIKDAAIALHGYTLSLETKRYRNVDGFDENFLLQLNKSYVKELEPNEMIRALKESIKLFFNEVEQYSENLKFDDIEEYKKTMLGFIDSMSM